MEVFNNKYCVRLGMIFFWIVTFSLFLLLPLVSALFPSGNTITILAMPNALNIDMFEAFTRNTGVTVSLTYAENADEIGMKLRTTRGGGYDLIMVADYQIPELIKSGIIQPLDHTQLNFFDSFYPSLLNHAFDPHNRYSLPYYWGVYGFGINKNYFDAEKQFAWDDIFDLESRAYMVGMRDDIRELIFIAAYYLFGTATDLTDQQYEQIKDLLIAQKRKVIMYADERIDSLLISGTVPLVFTLSGDISRVMNSYSYIDFVIPTQGSFIDIDSFVLSAACTHKNLVHTFLNYLYSVPVLSYYADLFKLSPPLSTVKSYVKTPLLAYPTEELFFRLQFFDTVIPQQYINAILVALKSA